MSNPFTRFLNQWSGRPDFTEFISYWDRLEAVVVGVYRQKTTPEAANAEYEQVWPWLREKYGSWEEALRPYWQHTRVGGQPAQSDPFLMLLGLQSTAAIVGDWSAMQHLPAAREALNQYLVDHSN